MVFCNTAFTFFPSFLSSSEMRVISYSTGSSCLTSGSSLTSFPMASKILSRRTRDGDILGRVEAFVTGSLGSLCLSSISPEGSTALSVWGISRPKASSTRMPDDRRLRGEGRGGEGRGSWGRESVEILGGVDGTAGGTTAATRAAGGCSWICFVSSTPF